MALLAQHGHGSRKGCSSPACLKPYLAGQPLPTVSQTSGKKEEKKQEERLHLSVALCRTRINNRAWSTKNTLACKLTSLSVRHSDRLVSFGTTLQGFKFPTSVCMLPRSWQIPRAKRPSKAGRGYSTGKWTAGRSSSSWATLMHRWNEPRLYGQEFWDAM